MVIEYLAPIGVAIIGGIGSAVVGAYSAGQSGEEFNVRKFVLSIPRSTIGAVLALGAFGGNVDVGTLGGFLALFGVGFTADTVITKLGRKNAEDSG